MGAVKEQEQITNLYERQKEFITKPREHKPPYELNTKPDGTKVIIIDKGRKKSPADKEYIAMLIQAGYIPVEKRTDITKSDMLKYVKNNYDQEEFNLLNEKLEEINQQNEETSKKITYATVKSWYKNRYIFYPKGLDWNFGTSTTAKEKKEKFIQVFEEHKQALKKDWRKCERQA